MLLSRLKPSRSWLNEFSRERFGPTEQISTELLNLWVTRNELTHTQQTEIKSAFFEQNIGSLENLLYNFLEYKWIYQYVNRLQPFLNTINSRVKRVPGLASSKVATRQVPHLVSLASEPSTRLFSKPRFGTGKWRIFAVQKGYKQSCTEEIFAITKVATFKPTTYNFRNAKRGIIKSKFYKPELTKVNGGI